MGYFVNQKRNTFLDGNPQVNPSAPENRGLLIAMPGVGGRPTYDPVNRIDGTLHGTTTVPALMPVLNVLSLRNSGDAIGDGLTTFEGGVYETAAEAMNDGTYSVCLRLYVNGTTGTQYLCGYRDATTNSGFTLYMSSGSLILAHFGASPFSCTFGMTMQTGMLYNIVCVYPVTDGTPLLFINGIEKTASGAIGINNQNHPNDIRIGVGCLWDDQDDDVNNSINGFAVDFRAYARALSRQECLDYANPATAYRLYEKPEPIYVNTGAAPPATGTYYSGMSLMGVGV